jgi:hypothetical protein
MLDLIRRLKQKKIYCQRLNKKYSLLHVTAQQLTRGVIIISRPIRLPETFQVGFDTRQDRQR